MAHMHNQGQLSAVELQELLIASDGQPVLDLNQQNPIPAGLSGWMAIRAQLRNNASSSRRATVGAVAIIAENGGMTHIAEGFIAFNLALRSFYHACVLQLYELHFSQLPPVLPNMPLAVYSGADRIRTLEQLVELADTIINQFEHQFNEIGPALVTIVRLAQRLRRGDMLPVQVMSVSQL